ncbi:transporter substrate-binding domain-containing protein [Paenibacillus phoenicis]|uniref:Transporter substrate-binding domain-containing protein n=1 Tax=Paenibacillus phoenicis TaxID=554117 RepID=A0ABU5PIA6_9BACL|nr:MULTISPECIES: transporter substrate-binding domain-containing protein [Paenibacillus]EES71924.1 ABC transporter, substrate-binding protein, family 3 [Paenibacillus sp. oral taxon 786 str. D14]MCT2194562.1 transporter substrate-binding domain-containing protein [Paenibacillus sp. p3-SID1389]MEA3569620.1 transporter substrate-binding domain-containing protein [Paenibacillus phoenicis]
MKKWGMLFIAVLMVTMVLAACGQEKNNSGNAANNAGQAANQNETQAGGDQTEPAKKLIVGMSADFPPYEFHIKNDKGEDEIVGFDVEIAKEIAKDLGAELEIKDLKFDTLLNELSSGRVDLVISGLSPTPERAEQIDMSQIYYKAEQAVVTREADKDKFSTMESLEGAKIGVQQGSIQEEMAKEIPNAKLTSLAKINDIIMQLNSNRVDAAILEGPVAESFVKNVKGLVITDAKPVTEDEGYVIGIKKGNQELLDQVNKTLDRLISAGSIDQFVAEASELAEK